MIDTIKKDHKIRNTRTGQVGVVTGIWQNIAGQIVFNVVVDGRKDSWNILSTTEQHRS